MAIEVKVPELGDGIESGDVLSILVSEGDVIEQEQGVVELETDKAVAEVTSSAAGKVVKIHVKQGETVPVGGVLLTLESADAESSSEPEADDEDDAEQPEASSDEEEEYDEADEEEADGDEEDEEKESSDDGEEVDVVVPELGDGIESGDVLTILVSVGDTIKQDQGVIELETDKAVAEVPSSAAGKVTAIHVKEGETVKVGGKVLSVAGSGGGKPAPKKEKKADKADKKEKKAEKKKEAKAEKKAEKKAAKADKADAPAAKATPTQGTSAETSNGQTAPAGPAVRRFARELGVDLTSIQGTGPSGRITKDDVRASVRQLAQGASGGAKSAPAKSAASTKAAPAAAPSESSAADQDKWGPIRRERMSRMRKTIALNMVESKTTIPHLTNFDDADVTELEKIRQASKQDYADSGIKLTTMPFIIKAVAQSLARHPVINASVDMESGEIIYKDYINVGLAVDTDRGLVVPVLRDCDKLSVPQIAHGLVRIADMARDASYTVDDLRGGTFTISNLGAIGGVYSTPIINPPEVAILLVGRSREMPLVIGGEVKIRLVMPLSLSYDHRIVDGAAAARFLNDVKGYLQAPGRLLLAP